MAVLTVQTVTRAGLVVEDSGSAAAGGGDSFANDGTVMLIVKNGGGSSITVTLDIQATTDGQAVTDKTVSVTNGKTALIGPFPTAIYNDGNGRTNVTYSGVTSITVMACKLTTS